MIAVTLLLFIDRTDSISANVADKVGEKSVSCVQSVYKTIYIIFK